ncbi:MAG: endopeptidase La [Firmicutes bacterium]|nr:endopeptidase La [Dethiobacter sp.]MBS3887681.1 endopeptidase La [Bacillota bacterium]
MFPVLPLRGYMVFPHSIVNLDVGRERSINAVNAAMSGSGEILLATQTDISLEEPTPAELNPVATLAVIKQVITLPGGTARVLVEGKSRASIVSMVNTEPYMVAEVNIILDQAEATVYMEALHRNVLEVFEQYVKAGKKTPPEVLATISAIDEPGYLADSIVTHLNLSIEDKQSILAAYNVKERLEKLRELIAREIEILEIDRRLSNRVRKQMEKNQREYYLREQIKAIQKELGSKDERSTESEELREKVASLKLPEEVADKCAKEIDRLERMPPGVAEAVVVRNYLDWVLSLPWGVMTEDSLNIKAAEEILHEDHYGLEKVKTRILEYLAVRQLTHTLKGPILCLVGPPGVGKTSLARSVARALNRSFVRMSLGGVRDEAEIRGHRRTYVGAMPGRIIQGLRQAKTRNPVFLLDEIDKMSTDFRGDPSAALLEVLDPEQNSTFADHFVEMPFDLSQVLFLTTANSRYNIPRPLLDRMEIIYISGYTEEEKLGIGTRHLIPKALAAHGLTAAQLSFSEVGIRKIINEYTREAGVRNFEREMATICRKIAKEVVSGQSKHTTVTAANAHIFLGAPRYRFNPAEQHDEVGISTGLVWTESGGDTATIEVTVMSGKGNLILTGQLGEVMRESAQAAYSYVRSRSADLGIEQDFYQHCDIHVHVPEGAIPKDGPSAGITLATALTSALSKRAVRKDVAMTGEITLRGRVLPIGGLKEKLLAAHRSGIKVVLVPKDNKRDLDEVPKNVLRRLDVQLVENMSEVLAAALVPAVILDA